MPSGRRHGQPDPEIVTFFLDRALGRVTVADAIRSAGHQALVMAEIYPAGSDQSVGDDEWILKANEEGWIALTKDYSIIRDHVATLSTITLCVFTLNNAQLTGPEMATRIVHNLNRMVQRSRKGGPFIDVITPSRLERRWPR